MFNSVGLRLRYGLRVTRSGRLTVALVVLGSAMRAAIAAPPTHGPARGTESAVGNRMLFGGRAFDRERDAYDYRTRSQDARAGRFAQRDTLGSWAPPGSVGNALEFTGSNPHSRLDPDGRLDCTAAVELAPRDPPRSTARIDTFYATATVFVPESCCCCIGRVAISYARASAESHPHPEGGVEGKFAARDFHDVKVDQAPFRQQCVKRWSLPIAEQLPRNEKYPAAPEHPPGATIRPQLVVVRAWAAPRKGQRGEPCVLKEGIAHMILNPATRPMTDITSEFGTIEEHPMVGLHFRRKP